MSELTNIPEISKLSNEFLLIDSGFIVTFNKNGKINFILNFKDGSKLGMQFSFEEDNSDKQTIDVHVKDNTVYVVCKNFKNQWGEGTNRPLTLGEFNGKNIYVGFWIYDLGKLKK